MKPPLASEKEELTRLIDLGWTPPEQVPSKRFNDENSISFPSENYESVDSDSTGFWIVHRANRIRRELHKTNHGVIWEVGAGNGNVSRILRKDNVGVICIEPLYSGVKTLVLDGTITFHGTLEFLKLPDESIKILGVFDVIEHLKSPEELLWEIHRVLQPGGQLICTVPAYQWLFSNFDLSIGHFRRYNRRSISEVLNDNGFAIKHIENIFSMLVIPAFIIRKVFGLNQKSSHNSENERSSLGKVRFIKFLNVIVLYILKIESSLKIPIGLSILVRAQKVEKSQLNFNQKEISYE